MSLTGDQECIVTNEINQGNNSIKSIHQLQNEQLQHSNLQDESLIHSK